MVRTPSSAIKHSPAMCIVKPQPFRILLRSSWRARGQSFVHAAYRRTIHAHALLWQQETDTMVDGIRLYSQSQTRAKTHGYHGYSRYLPYAEYIYTKKRARQVPISIEKSQSDPPHAGLVHRHHLCPPTIHFCLCGCGYGLVQPVCIGLEDLRHHGNDVLYRNIGTSAQTGETGNLQQRPRQPIYQFQFYRKADQSRYRYQYGWQGASCRQYLYRAFLAHAQVRGGLSQRLHRYGRRQQSVGSLRGVLQQRTTASVFGLPNPKTGPFFAIYRAKKLTHKMRTTYSQLISLPRTPSTERFTKGRCFYLTWLLHVISTTNCFYYMNYLSAF